MFPVKNIHKSHGTDEIKVVSSWWLTVVLQPDVQLYRLLADLSPDKPWGVRKVAAQKLGDFQDPEALEGLMNRLPTDPFWMVRCAIIQALERIGDVKAIPALRAVARNDSFQAVRSYAKRTIAILSDGR